MRQKRIPAIDAAIQARRHRAQIAAAMERQSELLRLPADPPEREEELRTEPMATEQTEQSTYGDAA